MIDKYRLGVVIGDVSGKGIAAALLMAVCKTLLKTTAYKGIPVDNILSEVNNILVDESPPNMFVTVFLGILDTRSGAFEYSNGGHNSPYLISNNGKIEQLADIGGLLLGAMKNVEYQSNVIMITPGESLIFYTDGITEAFNKDDEEFNEDRLENIISDNNILSPCELVNSIFENVQSFTHGVEQSDDITCLALKYLNNPS